MQAVSMVTYYGAMYLLPLADAVVIGLLHPPLTALLSWPILKVCLGA
jgi:drug/metabolite transporter (DMT)-like permease